MIVKVYIFLCFLRGEKTSKGNPPHILLRTSSSAPPPPHLRTSSSAPNQKQFSSSNALTYHCILLTLFNYFLGSNDQRNGLQQRVGHQFRGRCAVYNGSICSEHMNSKRFIYLREGDDQTEIEKRLERNLKSMKEHIAPKYFPDALRAVCIFKFPLCQNTSNTATPMMLCRKYCPQLQDYHFPDDYEYLRRLNCSKFPEIASNQICARLSMAGEMILHL